MQTIPFMNYPMTSFTLRHACIYATLAAASLLLSACGGGGGGGEVGGGNGNGGVTPTATVSLSVGIGGSPHAVANTVYGYQASITGAASGEFVWNWGDGTADSSGANVSKVWRKHGSFTNTLKATLNGQALSASRSARVAQPLSAGNDHTCAMADVDLKINDGTGGVLCWGLDTKVGRGIGNPGVPVRLKPVIVLGPNNTVLSNVVAVHASADKTCALKADGTVACWGQIEVAQPVAGFTDAVAIAVGSDHICALKANGSVACVGVNDKGQLGGGTISGGIQTTPVLVVGLADAVAISAGGRHTCALRASGAVTCWGDNAKGQLGDGTLVGGTTTVAVNGLTDAVAISAGANHSCALRTGGAVVCWGNNERGQLGSGILESKTTTTQAVSGLGDAVAISAGSGSDHTCALRAGGAVVCWGSNSFGQLGNGTTTNAINPAAVSDLSDVVAISAGNLHTCALKSDASAFCWGNNATGQLGDTASIAGGDGLEGAVVTANTSVPSKVLATKLWNFVPNPPGSVPTGTVTVPPATTTTIVCTDTPTALVTPTAITDGVGNFSVTGFLRGVANTAYSYLATGIGGTTTNIVWTWGDGSANSNGASVDKVWNKPGFYNLSLGATIGGAAATGGRQVAMAGEPVSASKSFRHTCALKPDGTVACWGSNFAGQLGNSTTTASNFSGTETVTGLTGVIALTTGSGHSCALKTDGSVACWGNNNKNQLGDGTAVGKTLPTAVTNLASVTAIAAGKDHTCAIKSNAGGAVVCWGLNDNGQLGDGTQTNSPTPKNAIGLLANVLAISAGDNHTCALASSGQVKCFGSNVRRQMGIGNATPTLLNTVPGLTNVVAISAGAEHTCALKADHTVACWGASGAGRNGNNLVGTETVCQIDGVVCATVNSSPVTVTGLTDAVAISAGNAHTCALRANGSLACWGNASAGQLGNDTTNDKNSPAPVACLTNAVSVSAGLDHTCALKADGSSACWGGNSEGQLGNGTLGSATNKKIPTSVLGGGIYWK
jgi:alpha-tubulin suppressor-like RCC1 family protein